MPKPKPKNPPKSAYPLRPSHFCFLFSPTLLFLDNSPQRFTFPLPFFPPKQVLLSPFKTQFPYFPTIIWNSIFATTIWSCGGEELFLNFVYHEEFLLLLLLHAIASMDELPGSLGTSASLALRFGQTIFSTASLLFMCLDVEFYSYTAFCYLVTVMGLVVPWSMTLVIVDVYSVFFRYLPRRPRITSIIILGDLALSYLSLAAACSTASTTYLLLHLGRSYCPAKLCTRYQLSAAMAFLSWFLSLGSSLFNLWLLPSL